MVGVIAAICGPDLTVAVTVIGMNSSINRLDDNITALRAERKADLDALSADVVELKLDTAQIIVRIEETERRLPEIESVDGRLDELEREQALKGV